MSEGWQAGVHVCGLAGGRERMPPRTIHRPIAAPSEQEPTHLKNTFEKEKNAVDVPLSKRFRHSQPESRETEKQEKV